MRHLVPVIAFVALAVGCQSKSNAKSEKAVAETTQGAPAKPQVEKGEYPRKNTPKTRPTSCRDDRDCSGFLRCEQSLCATPPAVDGRIVEGMPKATFTSADGKELASFHLEIADQSWERTRGLMYRRKMDPDFGMLFVFPDENERSFWMKNTLIPLDMVHIDAAGKVVGVVARAEPLTLSPRQTGEPARYVLELTAGRAAEVGIEAGAKMTVTNLPESLAHQ